MLSLQYQNMNDMSQLQKYVWLIETVRRAGRISHKEVSYLWERNINLSDGRPLHRNTFSRWRDAILDQFGIIINCQKEGGYLYYIENPEDIDDNKLQKWMLDSFAIGNIISDNLSLKERIMVDDVPSCREFLAPLLAVMKENRCVSILYRPFNKGASRRTVEPYCVRLFQNRWYLLGRSVEKNAMRIYSLDRIEEFEPTDTFFKMPMRFSAEDYFSSYFGINTEHHDGKPERIVIRAFANHKGYMMSLPLHHSQRLLADHGDYADFDMYLVPTYDFVLKLLNSGAMLEVLQPASLREELKKRVKEVYELYFNNDQK